MSNVVRVQVTKEGKLQDIFEWSNITITNAFRRAKRDIFRSAQYATGDKVVIEANDNSSVFVRKWVKPTSWKH